MKWLSVWLLHGLLSSWIFAGSLGLVPVWKKNVFSEKLRAPLLGAVSKDGIICLAMEQGQEAVLLNNAGEIMTHLGGDAVNSATSISAIGYDPAGDAFWIWSKLVGRLSRWDAHGRYLGTSTIATEISKPRCHDSRKIYLRRPDQGSQKSLFSFFPDQDEEVLIWQPSINLPRFGRSESFVSFAVGHHRLAVRDQRNLILVHLDEWQDDLTLPLPETWFKQTRTSGGRVTIQIGQSEQQVFIPIMADSHDQFWAFRASISGLGYYFVLFDGVNGSPTRQGTLEDLPLAVASHHLYFVDVEAATEIWLRKVRFEIDD